MEKSSQLNGNVIITDRNIPKPIFQRARAKNKPTSSWPFSIHGLSLGSPWVIKAVVFFFPWLHGDMEVIVDDNDTEMTKMGLLFFLVISTIFIVFYSMNMYGFF